MKSEKTYFQFIQSILLDEIDRISIYDLSIKIFKLENEKSKYNCIKRFCNTYCKFKEEYVGIKDMLVNLRDVMLVLRCEFELGEIKKDIIQIDAQQLGIEITEDDGRWKIKAIRRLPNWFENDQDYYDIYDFVKQGKNTNVIGDQYLKKMTGFSSYSSKAQKIIIRAAMKQSEGTTILASMPTGGGKSLTFQMPAFYGRGTSIVIVPTVALAIDQAMSSNKFFANKKSKPVAYYSGVDLNKRKNIFKDIINGEVPILYISPEALLNSKFKDVVLKAAANGKINRLVIDEAHIVADWGEFFRTEFQFLAVFRKELLKTSQNKLKTLLVSATVNDRTAKTLKYLFSEGENFIQIRADELRSEIKYYTVLNQSNTIRSERIVEMIPFIPRPFIIYVPTIKDSKHLEKLLKNNGYTSIERFTSETDSDKRKRVLGLWNDDKVDIMIATSAFGMGVDKKEVRAVIHSYVPESIDRFYQEVGRSGRDKQRAISISFTCKKNDDDIMAYLTRSKVLSADKMMSRWMGIKNNYVERVGGNKLIVSCESIPDYIRESDQDVITGKKNVNWNEYVLLFLYRKGLIDISDIIQTDVGEKRISIEIKNSILDYEEEFLEYMNPIREAERSMVNKDIKNITNLIREKNVCWAKFLSREYEYSEPICGGCPVCRKKNKRNRFYNEYIEGEIEITEGKKLLVESLKELEDDFNFTMIYEFENRQNFNESLREIIEDNKLTALIVPDKFETEKLVLETENYCCLYKHEEFLDSDNEQIIVGNIGVVYNDDYGVNDKLYKKIMKRKKDLGNVVAITFGDIFIKSENRNLQDCIDGYLINI